MSGFDHRISRRQRRLLIGTPLLSCVWLARDDGTVACFTELFLPDGDSAKALSGALADFDGVSVQVCWEADQVALRILASGKDSAEAVYDLICPQLQLQGGTL